MSPAARRYLLVMRHAQRQDEVQDNWAAAEAARPGGRPWDPPLSPCGLEQAAEAAAQLASWEGHTGARIVSIVTSPFLRCLQTSAAVCHRLGLEQLHISWLVSEALYRVVGTPTGPLPGWMWPRAPVEGVSHGDTGAGSGRCMYDQVHRGLYPEEFLVQLGAVVAPNTDAMGGGAACTKRREGQLADVVPGLSGEQAAELTAGPGKEGVEVSSEASARGARDRPESSEVLKGIFVTVLPPTFDSNARAGVLGAIAAVSSSTCRVAGLSERPPNGADGAPSYQQPPGEVDECADRGEPCTKETTGELGPHSCRPSDQCMDVAHVASRGAETVGDGNAVRAADDLPEEARALNGRWPKTSNERSANPDEGDVGAAGAAGAELVVGGVPYSPETLEAAHARYQAALRCLMAAAEPGAGGSATAAAGTERADAAKASDGLAVGLLAAADVGPSAATGDQHGLAPWRSLWRSKTSHACRAEDVPSSPTGDLPDTASAGSNGSTCDGGACGSASCRSISEMDEREEPARDGMPRADRRHCRHGCLSGAGAAEAVLVVTHGEAVACAVAMAVPWALVYEVKHTGFVVLESGKSYVDDGEEAEDEDTPVGSCASLEAVWGLLPDPQGERGVLWMSALDD